jgi:hypothetical protein
MNCDQFPSPNLQRRHACGCVSVCPWCYASEIEKLYHRAQATVCHPENVGKWLSVVERKSCEVLPTKGTLTEVEYFALLQETLIATFNAAKLSRAADSKQSGVATAIRYAAPAWVVSPKLADAGFALIRGLEVIYRSFLVTDRPAAAEHLQNKAGASHRIDSKLDDMTISTLLGRTLQQPKSQHVVLPRFKNMLLLAQRATTHRNFIKYGDFRGTHDA